MKCIEFRLQKKCFDRMYLCGGKREGNICAVFPVTKFKK